MGVPFCAQKNFKLKEAYESAKLPQTNDSKPIFANEVDKLLAKIQQ